MNQNPGEFCLVLNDDDPLFGLWKSAHSKVLSISQHHKVDSGAYFEGIHAMPVLDGKATRLLIQNISTLRALTILKIYWL